MKITNQQFATLLERYLRNKKIQEEQIDNEKIKYASAFKNAIEFLEKHIDSSALNLTALSSSDQDTLKNQSKNLDLFFEFIDNSIQTKNESHLFDENAAKAYKSIRLDPEFSSLSNIHLYDAPTNLGIREKFCRGILTNQHWLIDLDLERMLEITDTKSKIHILPFTKESIGTSLHFARTANHGKTEPYTIPLLLNLGSEGTSQGSHWISAVITVDPLQNSISYEINDELGLSEVAKQRYKKTIEEAIKFNDGFHQAYPQAGKLEGTVNGNEAQKDSFSCGYRALHRLFQNPAIRGDNPNAIAYSKVDIADSGKLVKEFVKQQLTDFELSREAYESLSTEKQKAFKRPVSSTDTKVKIEDSTPTQVIESLAQVVAFAPPESLEKAVTECVGGYQPGQGLMRFPGQKNNKLDSIQYSSLFSQLSELDSLVNTPLSQFILTHCDIKALDGLNAFYAEKSVTLFNELTITIDQDNKTDKARFQSKLHLALKNISRTNTSRVNLEDEQSIFNEDDFKKLIEFVKENRVSVGINLPKSYQNSELQLELDKLTSINQRNKNSELLAKEKVTPIEVNEESSKKPVRSRQKIDLREAMKIDVELQEQVEQDIQVQTRPKLEKKASQSLEFAVINIENIRNAVLSDDFSSFASISNGLTKLDFIQLFNTISGNYSISSTAFHAAPDGKQVIDLRHKGKSAHIHFFIGNAINGISDKALEYIAAHKEYFVDGINFRKLPQGFVITTNPKNSKEKILHFDSSLELKDAMAPSPIDEAPPKAISVDYAETLLQINTVNPSIKKLWENIKSSPNNLRQNSQIFRTYLPQLLTFPPEQADEVIALSGGVDGFEIDKFKFIFEHLKQADNSYSNPYDENKLISLDWMKSIFPEEVDRKRYINFAHSVMNERSNLAAKTHPLFQLLESDNQTQISDQLLKQKLTNSQLTGMLDIYDSYGFAGIQKLLSKWEAIDKLGYVNLSQLDTIKANVAGYEDLLLNNSLLENIDLIQGFSPSQRQWWNKLYSAHQPKADDINKLIKDFILFSNTVKSMGLDFYDLPNDPELFKNCHNLPTCLGRMLSIIQLCNQQDKSIQWKAITQIDLGPTGAICHISNSVNSERPCGFVLPQMKMDQNNLGNSHNFDTVSNPKVIANASDEDRELLFYRYIAYQKHRMPLSFYQEALKELEEARKNKTIPTESVNELYAILAESSTGNNYNFFINDVQTGKRQWKTFIDNIKDITSIPLLLSAEKIKNIAVTQISGLSIQPPLPVLMKLSNLTMRNFHKGGASLTQLMSLVPKMEENNEKLNGLVTSQGNSVYMGMMQYSDEDYRRIYPEERTLFEEHLHTSQAIVDAKISSEILTLISSFRITSQDVGGIKEKLEFLQDSIKVEVIPDNQSENFIKHFNVNAIEYVLRSLQSIENNNGLNPEKLKIYLEAVAPAINECRDFFYSELQRLDTEFRMYQNSENPDQEKLRQLQDQIISFNSLNGALGSRDMSYLTTPDNREANKVFTELLKTKIHDEIEKLFKANYPENYFENLKVGKPKPVFQLKIESLFSEENMRQTVSKILAEFKDIPDEEQLKLIQTLSELGNNLSRSERNNLFDALIDPRLLKTSSTKYLALLNDIYQYGSSSFLYFMNASGSEPIPELGTKAQYFLANALSTIRDRQDGVLQEIELVGPLSDLVLAAKSGELEKEIQVRPEQTKFYEDISKELASRDINRIENALQELERKAPNLADSDAIKALRKHLEWKKVDETEVVQEQISETYTEYEVQKRTGFFGFLRDLVQDEQQVPVQKTRFKTIEKTVPVIKNLDASLVEAATKLLESESKHTKTYDYAFKENLNLLDNLVKKYPPAKNMLLAFTRPYLTFGSPDKTQIEQTFENLSKVHDAFLEVNDQNTVISLCEHFGGNEAFKYTDFLAIINGDKINELDFANYPKLDVQTRTQILKIITSLLNNKKPCSLEDIQKLVNDCADKPNYSATLQEVFARAPFPTLDKLNTWVEKANGDHSAVIQEYKTWSKAPVEREPGINGFDLEYAKKQASSFNGLNPPYTNKELESLDAAVKHAQTLDTEQLLIEIKAFKSASPVDKDKLVAHVAELLYRTKGLPMSGVGKSREWGRSFEINTTQYLAIHSQLKAGRNVTSEIGTGEGKSRIMMIAIACQYALGNTVDFVTSDLSLATRDYLEYQAFFNALGAQSTLIYSHTPAENYVKGGINFSDATNLQLFRNKARSEGKEHLVMDDDPRKRSLALDEADKTMFDMTKTRFNYSAQANEAIIDIPWMYELLIDFFSAEENKELYYKNADDCNTKFYSFAKGKGLSEDELARLIYNPKIPKPLITRNQLEAWQSSALTAMSLELDKDFSIKPNVTIQTNRGAQIVSQAQLISGSRASGNAKFSFGVHQCLHARLNRLRKNPDANENEALKQALEKTQHDFYIDSENQIIYSSSSKALLNDYDEGTRLSVTGSSGSYQEHVEGEILYSGKDSGMVFLQVPRHRGLNRKDFPVQICNEKNAQNIAILESIRESLGKNPPQPYLLICENDQESQKLYEFLNNNLTDAEKANFKRIGADTSLEEEDKHITEQAGKPGCITISTPMLGRGTDIKLHKDAAGQTSGLRVVANFLPRERDYIQITGRAGRFGAYGESQLILNKEDVLKKIGKDTIPSEFYSATEAYLSHLQQIEDHEEQKQRIVKDIAGDFRLGLQNKFFREFNAPLLKIKENKSETLLSAWQVFFDNSDKLWNEKWPEITEELLKSPPDIVKVTEQLNDYRQAVMDEWKGMKDILKSQIRDGKIQCSNGEDFVDTALDVKLDKLEIPMELIPLIDKDVKSIQKGQLQTIIADEFHPAYVGRAVIYSNFTDSVKAFFKNIASAWRGESEWFPNLKAAQNGNMSWSQFFFGNWGSPPEKVSQIDRKGVSTLVGTQDREEIGSGQTKDASRGSYSLMNDRMEPNQSTSVTPPLSPGDAKDVNNIAKKSLTKDNLQEHTKESTKDEYQRPNL